MGIKVVASLIDQIRLAGLPEPEPEVRFHPRRKWRFDWAWKDMHIAAEQEGGIWTGGRHTRGRGYESDCQKYNAAALMGWIVFRFTPDMIASGEALQTLAEAMEIRQQCEVRPCKGKK